MSQSPDPFAAPKEAPAVRRVKLWSLVRFVTRRLLLIGVIPVAVGLVGGSVGGLPVLLIAWLVPILMWVPSTLVQLKVLLNADTADPRAIHLEDGRLISRSEWTLYISARAWETSTTALLLPVMALGFWRVSPALALGLATLLAAAPVVLIRYQWLGLKAGRAMLHVASGRPGEAETLLKGVVDARFTAPAFRRPMGLLLALAIARQGRADEALASLDEQSGVVPDLLAAQLRVGQGNTEPAVALWADELLSDPTMASHGFGAEVARAMLGGLLHLQIEQPAVVLALAEEWRGLQTRVNDRTARFLDLLEAAAHLQMGSGELAWVALRRRDAHTEDFPWLESLHPKVAQLRHELLKRR